MAPGQLVHAAAPYRSAKPSAFALSERTRAGSSTVTSAWPPNHHCWSSINATLCLEEGTAALVWNVWPRTAKHIALTLTCLDAPSVAVSFEPEGAHHELNRGDSLRVEISGPDDGDVEISYLPGGLVVGAWAGADTRAWDADGARDPPVNAHRRASFAAWGGHTLDDGVRPRIPRRNRVFRSVHPARCGSGRAPGPDDLVGDERTKQALLDQLPSADVDRRTDRHSTRSDDF